MTRLRVDVAVLGAGMGGSICAMLTHRVGLRTVLIERGAHPRFAIGESSTPVANLMLARLAHQYGLPRLVPLSKYGTWRRTYPNLTCGLKRGFAYVQHRAGEAFHPTNDHRNELFVCANPDEEHGDTQWLRSELDSFLVQEARSLGVPYYDQTVLHRLEHGRTWRLAGVRDSKALDVKADFVVDATGSAGIVGRALAIEGGVDSVSCDTRAIYTHFEGVRPWAELYEAAGGRIVDHPFPCDRCTLHHLFDGGWMWIIPFDNGTTSAGFVLASAGNRADPDLSPEGVWHVLLQRFPSIAAQFNGARALQPLRSSGRLQRRWRQTAGENWAMIPNTAYVLDPLHSVGAAHNLLGIARLVASLERRSTPADRAVAMQEYDARLRDEIDLIDRIVHGSYITFGAFELFTTYVMSYFLAATTMEHRLRAGAPHDAMGFLLADEQDFCTLVKQAYRQVRRLREGATARGDERRSFHETFAEAAARYNVAGLCDPQKRNMYPFA